MGFFPANAVGDDVELYADASRQKVLTTFRFLRQQAESRMDSPIGCLADCGGQPAVESAAGLYRRVAVTAGIGVDELVKKLKRTTTIHAIMTEALADRLAEAFAEYLHKRVRLEWGTGGRRT